MSTQQEVVREKSFANAEIHIDAWCLFFSLIWMIEASSTTAIIVSTVMSAFNLVFLGQALEYLPGRRNPK